MGLYRYNEVKDFQMRIIRERPKLNDKGSYKRHNVTPEAETGVRKPQTKQCLEPPERWMEAKNGLSPRAFRGSTALPTPWLQTADLQDSGGINFHHFKPLSPASLHFGTAYATLGNTVLAYLLEDHKTISFLLCLNMWQKNLPSELFQCTVQWY